MDPVVSILKPDNEAQMAAEGINGRGGARRVSGWHL